MILILMIFIVCWFSTFKNNILDIENVIGRFIGSAFPALMGSALFLLFNMFVSMLLLDVGVPIYSYQESKSIELITLQDNSNISGSFVLGSGNIGESMVYSFYYKDGTYVELKQIPTYKTKIQFSTETPKCVIYELKMNKTLINYIFVVPMFEGKENYVLKIPENTIIKNFNLDAK